MADFTITHRIEAPALVEAINNLAKALSCNTAAAVPTEEKKSTQITPKQDAPQPDVNPTPAPAPAPAPAAAAPTPAPNEPPAPAATVKPVTFDDIVAAGSQLLDAGRMADLLNLLKGFGVQAITQLKPEQYADVAVALRGLGAKI